MCSTFFFIKNIFIFIGKNLSLSVINVLYNLHIKYVYILKNITKRAVKSIDKVCMFELKFSQVIFITLSLIQDLCRLGNLERERERERGLSRIVRKKNSLTFLP